MRWEAERLERAAMLAGVALCALLLAAAAVQRVRGDAAEEALGAGFRSLCEELGYAPIAAPVDRPEDWCWGPASKQDGAPPVLLHWYLGSEEHPAVKGISATMPVGVLEGGGWGVELGAGSIRYWGDGDGADALKALLSPELLDMGTKIPVGVLMPMERVDRGSDLAKVIRSQWPEGWKGLAIRGLLGRVSRMGQSQHVFTQMANLRAALRGEPYQADSPPGRPPLPPP